MRVGSPLLRLLLLYSALFAAFGVASPFLPALLQQDGLPPDRLGYVLAAGTAVRLLAGPLGGRLADRSGRATMVLAGFTAAAAAIALLYGPARGLALLLMVSVAHAAVLAPLTPVADALALGSSQRAPGFPYGWVRGAGSAAFIVGALGAGQWVGQHGLDAIIGLNAGLLAVAAGCCMLVPNRLAGAERSAAPAGAGAVRALLALPVYVRLMAVACLVGGSHAMHDAFEVIRWRAAGLSAQQSSVLWALSVAGEVVVFFVAGPALVRRLGAGRAAALAAAAGAVRWSAAAVTAWFPVMALVEPLHGLTFALLHLACMDVIGRTVPARFAATAQAVYATVAMGAASAVMTAASGWFYQWFGPGAFWVMAAMCLAAAPIALSMRSAARVAA